MPWPRMAGAAGSSLMFFCVSVCFVLCLFLVSFVCLLFCVILSKPSATFSDDLICLALNSVIILINLNIPNE